MISQCRSYTIKFKKSAVSLLTEHGYSVAKAACN